MSNIKYTSAPAGSGKTFCSLELIKRQIDTGNCVWMCQPTKKLIRQTKNKLNERYPAIETKIIDGDGGNVTASLGVYLKDPYPMPHVLFTTHSAFCRLPFIPNKQNWHLIIDEVLEFNQHFTKTLPDTYHIITDILELKPSIYNGYDEVSVRQTKQVNNIANNKGNDDVYNLFTPALQLIKNNNYKSFINQNSFRKLVNAQK